MAACLVRHLGKKEGNLTEISEIYHALIVQVQFCMLICFHLTFFIISCQTAMNRIVWNLGDRIMTKVLH